MSSETNDLNTGLLIEVWSKGMIWDRAMGYHWIPLQGVQYSNEVIFFVFNCYTKYLCCNIP